MKSEIDNITAIKWLKVNNKPLFDRFARLCVMKLMGPEAIEEWARNNDFNYIGKGKESFNSSLAKIEIQSEINKIMKDTKERMSHL